MGLLLGVPCAHQSPSHGISHIPPSQLECQQWEEEEAEEEEVEEEGKEEEGKEEGEEEVREIQFLYNPALLTH